MRAPWAFGHGLGLCLSFMTRLVPGRMAAPEEFPRALPWFPAAGLAVGLLAVLPAWLGLFAGQSWLQAWLAVGLSLWLTRGLHADGLADIMDAWGSRAEGERFWSILKDSRAGSFGVIGLVMALTGQVMAFQALAAQGRFGAVAWCFVLGRLSGLALLWACRDRVRPGLGAMFAPGATTRTLLLAAGATLATGLALTTPGAMFRGAALSACAVVGLARLCTRRGGMNGDFIGAAIVLGELAAALGAVI